MAPKSSLATANIHPLTPVAIDPAEHKRQCALFLITSRRTARRAIHELSEAHAALRALRRQARKHRDSGNPVLARNAEVIESRIAEIKKDVALYDELLTLIGHNLRGMADDIERLIPTPELLDILEVNPVDRAGLSADAGLREIVFINGLEDSATHRASETKEVPLFRALLSSMMASLEKDQELQRKMNEKLFGKGSPLEFVPTYSRAADGSFVRNPPKLRLAD